jgi:hypothetical protein
MKIRTIATHSGNNVVGENPAIHQLKIDFSSLRFARSGAVCSIPRWSVIRCSRLIQTGRTMIEDRRISSGLRFAFGFERF